MSASDRQPATNESLEFPVMVRAGSQAPVMGIVEQLTASECRLRSLVAFDIGSHLIFELIIHGGPLARLGGTVSEIRDEAPRRHYLLKLDKLGPGEGDVLDRALAEISARKSAARTVRDGGALARSSVRVNVDFAVGYVVEGGANGTGRAVDLSTGGILMVCEPLLPAGRTLKLTFDLPNADNPTGARRELSIGARIVNHRKTATGTWANNISFTNLDPGVRADIAAFVGR
jgi:hypothetical protein